MRMSQAGQHEGEARAGGPRHGALPVLQLGSRDGALAGTSQPQLLQPSAPAATSPTTFGGRAVGEISEPFSRTLHGEPQASFGPFQGVGAFPRITLP